MKQVINLGLDKVYGKTEQVYMARLIDIDELADYLRLKKQTIYNWLHLRKISGIKIGGVWRFDRRDIDSWLKSRRRLSKTSGESQ